MNYYHSHVTKRAERDLLIEGGDFRWLEVSPHQVIAMEPPHEGLTLTNHRGKSIVWHEDTNEYEELYFNWMKDCVGNPGVYAKMWGPKTTETEACTRDDRIQHVYQCMKKKGFIEDLGHWGGVCVEKTGERIDGSYRSAIAAVLGIDRIRVKEYGFDWRRISRDFLERKLKADWLQHGLDYYAIDFGDGLKNYSDRPHQNYFLNVAKWQEIRWLIKAHQGMKIVDLGCNSGYHALQLAREGASVTGIDFTLTGTANLHKLVYEFLEQRSLDATFVNADIRDLEGEYDVALALNVHYHLPLADQLPFFERVRKCAKQLIVQGNTDKSAEYKNVDIPEITALLKAAGWHVVEARPWERKPIIIAI